jgi:hypothetical protein
LPPGAKADFGFRISDFGWTGLRKIGNRQSAIGNRQSGNGRRAVPQLYALEKPPASLEQFGLVYTPTPRGYVFQLTMPRAALAGLAGGPVESFGFDVAVDDADQPGQRKAQMIWAGVAENFINPRYFGEISLRHPAPGNARLTVW